MSASLQSLKYSRGTLEVLDQLQIPNASVYVPVKDCNDAWEVIRSMKVRGAPLIAITAAMALAVEAHRMMSNTSNELGKVQSYFLERLEYLRTSRPTAVNLFIAADEFTTLIKKEYSSVDKLLIAIIEAAETMRELDIKTNMAIGAHGAKRILEIVGQKKVKVLTICNTGSLATAGYGTALGVVRALNDMGNLDHVYACETRPYNQGSRLTAFEIVMDNLPGTLIADSMASALMAVKGVDCVVVGADRVASNGDTANKIGTYQLAIAANYHNIPFFAAVPTTTLDLSMASGAEIHVEERCPTELTKIFDRQIAPVGISAWNPSFDVTPCNLIKGIITELGVIESTDDRDEGVIPVADYLKSKLAQDQTVLLAKCDASPHPDAIPPGYKRMQKEDLTAYVCLNSKLSNLLQVENNVTSASTLKIDEVGDGNLNYVYIIEGNGGNRIVVKQALPYVRCVGESWPLTLQRAYYECAALQAEAAITGTSCVPEVYHFDRSLSLIAMRYIQPPHMILRKAFLQGLKFSTVAADIGDFLAKTLFATSGLALKGGSLRRKVAHWSNNNMMCALTEQVVFTDPYFQAPSNRHTSPQLDTYASSIQNDENLKLAAAYHKNLFLTSTQALLHGDLHSGSVMAMEGSTFVIDPEFAFYGPMGFDIGAFMANMFLNYFSNTARFENDESYSEWILQQVVTTYNVFKETFVKLWDSASSHSVGGEGGEIYKKTVFAGEDLKAAQLCYMDSIWRDTLGFTGMKMIRRVVGIAHVEDLDSIADPDQRAACEKRCLVFGKALVLASYRNNWVAQKLFSFKEVINILARPINTAPPPEVGP